MGRQFHSGIQGWTEGMGPEEGQEVRGRPGCDGVREWMQSAESLLPWGQVTAINTQFLLVQWRCWLDDLRSSVPGLFILTLMEALICLVTVASL